MSRPNSDNHSSGNTSSGNPSLRERMSQDLQLRGMAERTQVGYVREVRKLAGYYNSPPDQLSEQQVGEYLLYLINDCNFAPGSLGVMPTSPGRIPVTRWCSERRATIQ